MKQCAKCLRTLEMDQFPVRKDRNGSLNSYCFTCRSNYSKEYHAANRVAINSRTAARNSQIRADVKALIRARKSVPCADCNKEYPYYVMDFDHVRGKKKFNIGAGANSYSLRVIEKEIDKCEVVCSNCHRQRTHSGIV